MKTVDEITACAGSQPQTSRKRKQRTVIFLKAEDQEESTCNEKEQSDKRHFFPLNLPIFVIKRVARALQEHFVTVRSWPNSAVRKAQCTARVALHVSRGFVRDTKSLPA